MTMRHGPLYAGDFTQGIMLEAPSSERMAWACKRIELARALRECDSKRLEDLGNDASGQLRRVAPRSTWP